MKVKYIAPKRFEHIEIQDLLKLSESAQKFTNDGPVKKLLEAELQNVLKIQESNRVVCVSNGSTALHVLFYLFQKMKGRKLRWLTPAFTFPTPCIAGFDTAICDIDLETFTIPCDQSLDDYDGIILTNLFGSTVQIDYWVDRCKKEDKLCIFDNASSPMSSYRNINIMNFGDASFGSLHHTKLLGVGEGGFVVVDKAHYDEINKICNFGFNDLREFEQNSSNFKMSDISASYILSHIRHFNFEKFGKTQNLLIERVKELKSDKFNIFMYNDEAIFGNLPILFKDPCNKEVFIEQGIEVNKYYKPLSKVSNAEMTFAKIINFPLNDQLTNENIDVIIKGLKRYS